MTDYATITDWVDFIRDCLRLPDAHRELDPDHLNVDAGLSKVGAELSRTPYGVRFADAALTLLEHGTPDEQRQLLQIGLRQAPSAGARVATIARRWRGTALAGQIRTLLGRGLEAAPHDPQLLGALDEEARIDPSRAIDVLNATVPHNVDWVVQHLDLLPAAVDPDGKRLRFLALRTVPAELPALVAGIAAAGQGHVDRLVAALTAPDAPPHLVDRLRPHLAANPAFAGRLP